MRTGSSQRPHELVVELDGESYLLATPEQASELGGRMWQEDWIPDQDIPDVAFSIPIVDFSAGAGFTFEGPPGTYEDADGWACETPGRPSTWARHAVGDTVAVTDSKGWLFFLGNHLYMARGRYVVKYAVNENPSTDWTIKEIHDLGSSKVVAGRPKVWGNKAYVPRRASNNGADDVFHELTTTVTTVTETQTIVISGTPTSGSYTVTYDGRTSGAIAYNANQAAVQAALRAIPGLDKVTVVTTGSAPNYTHTVTMTAAGGALGGSSPPQMTSTDGMSGGTHAIAHATTVAGTVDTWTAGPATREARCFTVWNGKLVYAHANYVRTCAASPLTAGNWAPGTTNGYEAGDASRDITDLYVYRQYLMATKVDGLYSWDENLFPVQELPDLEDAPDDQAGIGGGYWNGALFVPNKAGFILWAPGVNDVVGPERDGFLDGALSTGWGRVSGIAAYGRYAFVALNDTYNQRAVLGGFLPPTERRTPVVPHSYQQEAGASYEDVHVLATTSLPAPTYEAGTASDDNAVGTVAWSDAANAAGEADGEYATAQAGTSHYLKLTNIEASIPADATIMGVTVEIVRSAYGAATVTTAAALASSATMTAVGTKTP